MIAASSDQQQPFRAYALPPKMAARAFPLVRLANPSIEFRGWTDHVRGFAKMPRGTGGVIAIEDERGYIHCLFSWSAIRNLTYGKALRVSDLIIAHLPGRAQHEAVLAEIQRLANIVEAGAIVVEPGENVGGLPRDVLLADGYKPDGERFNMIRETMSSSENTH
jgi:hypothetical protein